ncbi:hypothetical protein BDY21DRAFT_142017 [Lineolata rhizophorae]|uniref:F-box domain-containing protein n=1 Tax=Lineolata rhizophorae TaxID=578093 RepID=A0A6A6NNU0_9PEZI|nr:hypothetical protein BDY21DRAFT_142017 [Lineolata rhizophorae]
MNFLPSSPCIPPYPTSPPSATLSIMDKLPLEAICLIVENIDIPAEEYLKYATVSRKFQYAVETITFKNIVLQSNRIEYWAQAFQKFPHRRRFVRSIFYIVMLPLYRRQDEQRMETSDNQQANNKAFTESFAGLVDMLHSWEEEYKASWDIRPKIKITYTFQSPSDLLWRCKWNDRRVDRDCDSHQECWKHLGSPIRPLKSLLHLSHHIDYLPMAQLKWTLKTATGRQYRGPPVDASIMILAGDSTHWPRLPLYVHRSPPSCSCSVVQRSGAITFQSRPRLAPIRPTICLIFLATGRFHRVRFSLAFAADS